MMATRRLALTGGAIGLAAFAVRGIAIADAAETFEVSHTDAEWHKLLTPVQYSILRQSDTERPFASPLLHEARRGNFACAGCDFDLFSSSTKYDSGTGWPSFWAPLDNAVATQSSSTFGMSRTAVHCRAAAVILATCSTTVPSPPACATA
jgi:peptide-methionine (R)-S-oxide reductase